MRPMMEVWGANMHFQLILDLGMVTGYMTKYFTKTDTAHNQAVHRLTKNPFHKTFLRQAMRKLLRERMISKKDCCHLMLGLQIVSCLHKALNVNLTNTARELQLHNASVGENANDNEDSNIV